MAFKAVRDTMVTLLAHVSASYVTHTYSNKVVRPDAQWKLGNFGLSLHLLALAPAA